MDEPHDDHRMGGRAQGARAARLMELLGLSEEELCLVLDADALTLLSGQLQHRSELPLLLELLDEAAERAGSPVLRRWVRASGPAGRPVEALLRRDFGAFEDALGELAARGFVVRGGGGARSDGGTPREGGAAAPEGGGAHREGGAAAPEDGGAQDG
jgi:hypothetical protein